MPRPEYVGELLRRDTKVITSPRHGATADVLLQTLRRLAAIADNRGDATAAGLMISVDSDCHHAPRLGAEMRYGVSTSRRGWIASDHVVNAWPLSAIREIVRHKRTTARG